MNLTGTAPAPVRQPVPELPEKEFPGPSPEPETRESSQKTLASLSLLWERRRLLFRVSINALLATVFFVLLALDDASAHGLIP